MNRVVRRNRPSPRAVVGYAGVDRKGNGTLLGGGWRADLNSEPVSHQALPARDRLIVYHRGRSSSLAGIYTWLGFVLEKVLMRQPRAGRDVCR
jgi:hypothetical protein